MFSLSYFVSIPRLVIVLAGELRLLDKQVLEGAQVVALIEKAQCADVIRNAVG
jgi:hypothetical protein